MTSQVVVIDYGVGNLHSVVKALRARNADVLVSQDPSVVARADRLILPGVGAFADGMRALTERGLVGVIREYAASSRPFLGICLGMQLLFSESEEFGRTVGLGIIEGKVMPIVGEGIKVPHVGWNQLHPPPGRSWEATVLQDQPLGSMMYFVHSYFGVPASESDRLADVHYGVNRMAVAVQRKQVIGCQFHPEKSGPAGLAIIDRFLSS